MKEIISTITSKGQVTIPAEIRRHLRVGTHDRIVFVLDDRGTVTIKVPHYPTIASLRGAAGSLKRPLDWAAMRQIAREDRQEAEQRDPE